MTPEQYLKMLPQPHRWRAMRNALRLSKDKEELRKKHPYVRNVAEAIDFAFAWSCTPEGGAYWSRLYRTAEQGAFEKADNPLDTWEE